MIYLNQVGKTNVVTTFYENCVNRVNPFFAWKITDKDSNEVTTFCADDFSLIPNYWNIFSITLSPTMSGPTQGIINIPASIYTYQVYEMANQYDLNLNNAIGLVETGLITINATYTPPLSYTQSNNDITLVYRNQNRI